MSVLTLVLGININKLLINLINCFIDEIGIGRAGKSYNIKERAVPDWEREEILRENEVKNSK